MTEADRQEELEPLTVQAESWEDTEPEDERDPWGEGRPAEPFSAEIAEAQEWTH